MKTFVTALCYLSYTVIMLPIAPLYRYSILLGSWLAFMVVIMSCQKKSDYSLTDTSPNIHFQFRAVVAHQPFALETWYTNPHQESFRLRAFKFYISAIDLINETTHTTFQLDRNQYYLVDFSDTTSLEIKFNAPPATYHKIAFTIGVDSTRNVSGAQTGALDPAYGMFWTWNTGYIMAKMEGYSPVSNQPNQLFEYHIGGFKGVNNVVKKVYLNLPTGNSIHTQSDKINTISITADVNKWFVGPNAVSIAGSPVCIMPGSLAVSIADNYRNMFSVVKVIHQ